MTLDDFNKLYEQYQNSKKVLFDTCALYLKSVGKACYEIEDVGISSDGGMMILYHDNYEFPKSLEHVCRSVDVLEFYNKLSERKR